jgi:hypothetical protein
MTTATHKSGASDDAPLHLRIHHLGQTGASIALLFLNTGRAKPLPLPLTRHQFLEQSPGSLQAERNKPLVNQA